MTTTNKYRDFSLTFSKHPITGDLSILTDEKAVNQSLKNLMFTNFYDVPFQPRLGSNLRARLFDLATSMTADTIKSDIEDVIENFEPRIEVIDITADVEGNGVRVTLRYRLRTSTNDITVSYFLERIT
jgi:phage baseplate assembly protein W